MQDVSKKAALYRTAEPVDIVLLESGRRNQELAIRLQPGEWTAYAVNVPQPGTYALLVRAKAGAALATVRIAAGKQKQSVAVAAGDFCQQPVGQLKLKAGPARLVVSAIQGEVLVDWLELSSPAPTSK